MAGVIILGLGVSLWGCCKALFQGRFLAALGYLMGGVLFASWVSGILGILVTDMTR